jgi:ubiquinone/menaquinone biosynthesis C-methylase UbiE
VEKTNPYYAMFFEEIVTLIGEQEAALNFLDVGCNYGRRTNMLAYKFPDKEFTGIDLNPKNIEFGLHKLALAHNVSLQAGDALSLPFSDNSFDVVYTIVSVSHMSHDIVTRALHEMARVCRKTLILVEVDLFVWPLTKQLSTVRMNYMFFHHYLSIVPQELVVQKVVHLHCDEVHPRYSAFVFSKKE